MSDALRPVTTAHHDRQIDQQLAEVESRLRDRYTTPGTVDEAQVTAAFGRVTERFTNARVRNFLPILVERGVRRELGL
jgi:hypothetical protein